MSHTVENAPAQHDRSFLLAPLRQRDFALLWTGQSVSRLGDSAYSTVLAWTVLAISNSPAAIGYVLTAASIPQVILLLAGGLVGDRFSRRAVILVSDSLSGLAVGAVAVLSATGHLTVPILVVLAAVFGAVSAFFLPAYGALIPEIVPRERLQTANSLQGISGSAIQIVGPSFGALIYAWGRATAAFGFDALTFFIAAVASYFIRMPRRPYVARGSIWPDIKAGWGYVRRTTWVWLSIGLATVYHTVTGAPLFVLIPLILRRHLHLGIEYMGLTFTIAGIASIVTNVVLAQYPPRHHRGPIVYAGWALLGVAPLLMGLAQSYVLIAAGAVLLGIGTATDSIWGSLVQQHVPAEYLSRVVSLDYLGSFGLRPVGLAGAGLLATVVDPSTIFIVGGAIGAMLFVIGGLSPPIRHLD